MEHLPLPVDDPARRCPVITRASQVLGWQPQIRVEDGVRRMVEWFRSRPEEDGGVGREALTLTLRPPR